MQTANDAAITSARIADQATAAALRLTREGLALTRQSTVTDSRAWVLLKRFVDKELALDRVRQTQITVAIQNYGKAPAMGLAVTGHGQILKSLPEKIALGLWPKDLEFRARPGAGVLAPGEPLNNQITVGPFPDAEIHALAKGEKILVVTGLILYHDLFKIERKTTFCATYSIDGLFRFCERFNIAE